MAVVSGVVCYGRAIRGTVILWYESYDSGEVWCFNWVFRYCDIISWGSSFLSYPGIWLEPGGMSGLRINLEGLCLGAGVPFRYYNFTTELE